MEERIREILREDDDAVGDLVDLITEYQQNTASVLETVVRRMINVREEMIYEHKEHIVDTLDRKIDVSDKIEWSQTFFESVRRFEGEIDLLKGALYQAGIDL